MRTLLCLLLCCASATAEGAGRRRVFHSNGCYTYQAAPYYPQQTYQRKSVAEVLGAISEQKQAYDALTTGIATIFPQQYEGAGYGSGQYTNTETYGPQGNTGHGYQQQYGGHGTLDTAAAFDRADRWASNALQVAGQAGVDLRGIVQTGVDGEVRVAEVLARGQAAAAALNAAAGQPAQLLNRTVTLNLEQDASGQWQTASQPGEAQPGPGGDPRLAFLQVAQQSANESCAKCHSGPDAKGGLDVSNLAALPPERWLGPEGIIDRITTDDPNKLMPKGPNGKGVRLGNGVVRWWLGSAPDEPEPTE